MTQTPAGWFPVEGGQRYWDGAAWTEHFQADPPPPPRPPPPPSPVTPSPTPAPAPTSSVGDGPLLQFTSHIAGKNAQVRVFANRIEWQRQGGMTTGRAGLAVATGGLSLMAKSGRGGGKGTGSEVIPMRSVTSVTTRKDGFSNSVVSVITAGNTIDMRVSHAEADMVKNTILAQL